jgi:hypothetical protein
VKNCQHSERGDDSRTRIIQAVTALESEESPHKSEDKSEEKSSNEPGNPPGSWPRRSAPRSFAARSFLAALVLLAIVYGTDYGVFRYRLATNRQPFGSVTVEHYDAIEHKDGKAELIFDPPVQQTCVHSLFPHGGDLPCWFLSRHAEQRTDI